jgi:hypothetical protein
MPYHSGYITLSSLENVKKRVDLKTLSSSAGDILKDLKTRLVWENQGRRQRAFPFILPQPVLQGSLPSGERAILSAYLYTDGKEPGN